MAPEGSLTRRLARSNLIESAREAARHGYEYWQWMEGIADAADLDVVSQRDVDVIVVLVWGIGGGAALLGR